MNPETENLAPREDLDYSEDHDIRRLHAGISREKQEPQDGNEPLSLWLVCFFGATLFLGGIYLALFSGNFSWTQFDEGRLFGAGDTAAATAEPVELTPFEIGERVFRQNCVACHQGNGMGVPGAFPTLVGTHWVTGSEKRLAAILLHGMQGPLDVNGTIYNGAMPGWEKNFNDERMAGVLTYIRQSWGNQADAVSPAQVASARTIFADRTTPWTEAEILAIPEDATLEGAEEEAPVAEEEAPVAEEEAPAESEG